MSPELGADSSISVAQQAIHGTFTDYDTEAFRVLGGEGVLGGTVTDPTNQVAVFCGVALKSHDLTGYMEVTRRSLDAAVTVTDSMANEGGPEMYDYEQVKAYMTIAKAARRTDQDPDYIRDILEKATAKALGRGESDNRYAERLQLRNLAELAHGAGQSPAVISLLVDRIRELNRRELEEPAMQAMFAANPQEEIDHHLKKLDSITTMARRYSLGANYITDAINEERRQQLIGSNATEKNISLTTDRLNAMALMAHNAQQDPAFVREIIEEAREIANRSDNSTELLGNVARAAHLTEQPDAYVVEILEDGFEEVVNRGALELIEEPRVALGALNNLLQAMYGRKRTQPKINLQNEIVTRGLYIIEAATEQPRERHKLLNRLLRNVFLSEDFMTANGLEHRPLSYVFSPRRES